jgi:hypothetical protein
MVGAWFLLARWQPHSQPPARPPVAVEERLNTLPASRALPKEDLVLVDTAGRRFYVLRGRAAAAPADPVELQAMRTAPDGRLQLAGRYRWDPAKGTLTDVRTKRNWTVQFQAETGVLQAPAAGVLQVASEPPGAECWVNGKSAGRTPVKLTVRAGVVQVRVRWESGRVKSAPVFVPPGDVGAVELRAGGGS